MTADEKREADRIKQREARLAVTAAIEPPEWYEAEADSFEAEIHALHEGQTNGTIPTYESAERWYSAGGLNKVGRIEVDEGKARAYGVADVLIARGFDVHNMMSFEFAGGRQGVRYAVRSR
jgi:hypothetical protein